MTLLHAPTPAAAAPRRLLPAIERIHTEESQDHPAQNQNPTNPTISPGGYALECPEAFAQPRFTETPSSGSALREHPIPEDSILAEYRDYVRDVSEAPDSWLVAPVLALCARLLTPKVYLDFGERKPLTLYQFIVGRSGLRKSTTFTPAEILANRLLSPESLVHGNASDSALFDSFEREPNKLQFEDEGNTILQTWASAHYGRETAARYLKLYDGKTWGQNFRHASESHRDGKAERIIQRATLSLAIGATLGVSRFQGIDAASGLRRRFGYYTSMRSARVIEWPRTLDSLLENFEAKFRKLTELEGRVGRDHLTEEARDVWRALQLENRRRASELGISEPDETQSAALNEAPARILKLAVIFQACRWAQGSISDPRQIDAPTLELAKRHQDACLESAAELEILSRQAALLDEAHSILARVRADHLRAPVPHQEILLDKTSLTARFAPHPERRGALTPTRLHGEILPLLIRRGSVRIVPGLGRKVIYAFTSGDE